MNEVIALLTEIRDLLQWLKDYTLQGDEEAQQRRLEEEARTREMLEKTIEQQQEAARKLAYELRGLAKPEPKEDKVLQ